MKARDYIISMTVNASAQEAFNSINSVSKWWTENIEGGYQKLNDEFTVRFDDVHISTQKLIEFIPDKKVTWLVTDSKLSFVEDVHEWTDTEISFEIFNHDSKTEIQFTHKGLVPDVECYKDCSTAWSQYIRGSLLNLITTGIGKPEKKK
jgi:hypothetical protein